MDSLSQKIANEIDVIILEKIDAVFASKFQNLKLESKDLQQLLENGKNFTYAAVIRNLANRI